MKFIRINDSPVRKSKPWIFDPCKRRKFNQNSIKEQETIPFKATEDNQQLTSSSSSKLKSRFFGALLPTSFEGLWVGFHLYTCNKEISLSIKQTSKQKWDKTTSRLDPLHSLSHDVVRQSTQDCKLQFLLDLCTQLSLCTGLKNRYNVYVFLSTPPWRK